MTENRTNSRAAFRAATHDEQASFFEFVIQQTIAAYCRPGTAAIDAGSAGGDHAVSMAKAVGSNGRVHAFEPNPDNINLIATTCAAYPWVQVHPLALSSEHAKRKFYLATEQGMGSLHMRPYLAASGHDPASTGTIEVQASPLDAIPAIVEETRNISLIKCDIEGEEMAFLEGAVKTIAKHHPIIMLELDENVATARLRREKGLPPTPVDWGTEVPEVYRWLASVSGGVLFDFFGDHLRHHTSNMTWCVAILPVHFDRWSFSTFLRETAERYWHGYRNWRIENPAPDPLPRRLPMHEAPRSW